MSTYIAQTKTSEQISPDEWRIISPALEITDTTTVEEIVSWYRSHCPKGHVELKIIGLDPLTDN